MPRSVAFNRVHNFRDLGGLPAADGQVVRAGAFFRADSLAKLDDDDWTTFERLGIRTVVDLRYPWEIAAAGRVREHPSLEHVNLSIEHRPYDQPALGPEVDAVDYLGDRFAEVLEDGTDEIRQVVEIVADAGRAPVVVHCTSGKDRTGLVVALVLALLEVPRAEIVADFALTGLATERLRADWTAANGGVPPRWPAYGTAPAALIERVLDDLDRRYGSVAAYVSDQLGVDTATVAALRAHLLVPGAGSS